MLHANSPLRQVAALLFLAIAVTAVPAQETPAPAPRPRPVPPGGALIEFDLPPKASLFIEGKNWGAKRFYEEKECRPGELHRLKIKVELPDALPRERTILYQRGWSVRVPIEPPELVRPAVVAQTGHADVIYSIQFSPTGDQILTASADRSAILWDASSGQRLRSYAGVHTDFCTSVRFLPTGDRVVTAGRDNKIVFWERTTGKKLLTLTASAGIVCLAVRPDGKQLAAGCFDGSVEVLDLETLKPVHSYKEHKAAISSIQFSAKGEILTASGDSTVLLYNPMERKRTAVFSGFQEELFSAALSPDGRVVVTGTKAKTIVVWDLAARKPLRKLTGHQDGVICLAFSPDGKQLASGSFDKTTIVWDTTSWKPVQRLEGHRDKVLSLGWRHDGQQLLTGSWDKSGIVWEMPSGKKLQALVEVTDRPWALAFSQDGKHFFSGAGDKTGVLWQPENRRLTLLSGHAGRTVCAAFGPGDQTLLTGSDDKTALLWDLKTLKPLQQYKGHTDWLTTVVFSPEGRRVLTSSLDGTAIIWDLKTGAPLRKITPKLGMVWEAAFHPDGRWIATVHDKHAALWDLQTGNQLLLLQGHKDRVVSLVFTPERKHLITLSTDATAILWNLETGQQVRTFKGHTKSISCGQLLPGGKYLVTGSFDGTLRLWDVATGKTIGIMRGHTGPVDIVTIHPSGRYVLSGAGDGQIRFWDLATRDTALLLYTLNHAKDWLVVTPEGLFDGSEEGRQTISFRLGAGVNLVPVDRFFQDFYVYNLLPGIWLGNRPLPTAQLGKKQAPLVRIVPSAKRDTSQRQVQLDVEVIDQGGGVAGPVLKLGQQEIQSGIKPQLLKQGAKALYRFTVDLLKGKNRLVVTAASADKGMASEPAVVSLDYRGAFVQPALHMLAVGVSAYQDKARTLRFAARDAESLVDVFRRRGKAVYQDKIHITLLQDQQASRKALLAALDEIAEKAQPQDTLVLLLAGHGVTIGQRYYFLPHDYQKEDGQSLQQALTKTGVPIDVLQEKIRAIKVQRRVVILDTCESGGALGQVGRSVFDYGAVLEHLHHSDGGHWIAAAGVEQEAHEPLALKHGILTYSLLGGLGALPQPKFKVEPIRATVLGGMISVEAWFQHAKIWVPKIAEELSLPPQRPYTKGEGSGTFPLLPLGG